MFLLVIVGSVLLGMSSCLPNFGHSSEAGVSELLMGSCRDNDEERRMFHERVDQMQQCYGDLVNWNHMVKNDIEGVVTTTAASVSKGKECSLLNNYINCMSDFLTSVQHCYGPEEQSAMQSTLNGTRVMLEWICHAIMNASSDMTELISAAKCVKVRMQDLYACAGDEKTDKKILKNDNLATGLLSISYNEENCRGLHEAGMCIDRVLDQCKPSQVISGFEEGLNKFYTATPCKEILQNTTNSVM